MEKTPVFRRLFVCVLAALLLAGMPSVSPAAQKDAQKDEQKKEKSEQMKKPAPPPKFDKNNLTAEQIAELVILYNGSREGLKQIRRTGIERGKIIRTDG